MHGGLQKKWAYIPGTLAYMGVFLPFPSNVCPFFFGGSPRSMDVFSFPIVCLAETFWNLIIYDACMGFELKDPQIIQYYTHKSRTNVKLHIYNNCKYVVYIYNSFARFKFV
jgi:hypothetical protein